MKFNNEQKWVVLTGRRDVLVVALLPRGKCHSYLLNSKVQHILASTSYNGTTVVWNLKKQKPVISFADSGRRRRCSALPWNPDVATQLVASDEDGSPSIRV
ncbi:unnamed protein product [Trifolium pratense]|uniref:Uncharacterized protein n=1 Tax=Trifolium pratense TaxID=57577 RepID=A0ACB0K9H8_TRIPR|nr:unnamed protein product [Trifolium pratense]